MLTKIRFINNILVLCEQFLGIHFEHGTLLFWVKVNMDSDLAT